MFGRRLAVLSATAAAIALPVLAAPAANAAPAQATAAASSRPCDRLDPYAIHDASAVRIHTGPSTSSTVVGLLYQGEDFTVNSTTSSGSWVSITDNDSGVSGWVSGEYVYQMSHMCLD